LISNNNVPVIPGRNNPKERVIYDKAIYKLRNRIEICFGKIKENRRLSVRYRVAAEEEGKEAKGGVDSSFDDELLTSAINSNLMLRREYAKFQEAPAAENPYF